jgi:hypothetical protein
MIAVEKQEENQKVIYEESILITLLGDKYSEFIKAETGEWAPEQIVRLKF